MVKLELPVAWYGMVDACDGYLAARTKFHELVLKAQIKLVYAKQ